MERVQKKCLIVSAGMHGLLLASLLIGVAFVKKEPVHDIVPVTVFDSRIIDSVLNGGGGAPAPAPPPVRAEQPPPTRRQPPTPPTPPTPPKPPPETPPVTPPRRAEIPPVTPREDTPKKPEKVVEPKAPPKRHVPKISTEAIIRRTEEDKSKARQIEEANKARAERVANLQKTIQGLGQRLNRGGLSTKDMPGSGPGAVNYSQVVLGIYDNAWNAPNELSDDVAVVLVRVRVHLTGKILYQGIITRSNNALMDRSVQNALEAVKSLPPFPKGARDLERTFNIEFNLKTKRAFG